MKSKLSLFALAVLLLAAPAEANQLWTWTGTCTTNSAGGLPLDLCHTAIFKAITIDSYVPGTPIGISFGPYDPTTLVSAAYLDDAGGFLPAFDFFRNAHNLLFPATSGAVDGFLSTETAIFQSFADGTWRFEAEAAAPNCNADNVLLRIYRERDRRDVDARPGAIDARPRLDRPRGSVPANARPLCESPAPAAGAAGRLRRSVSA